MRRPGGGFPPAAGRRHFSVERTTVILLSHHWRILSPHWQGASGLRRLGGYLYLTAQALDCSVNSAESRSRAEHNPTNVIYDLPFLLFTLCRASRDRRCFVVVSETPAGRRRMRGVRWSLKDLIFGWILLSWHYSIRSNTKKVGDDTNPYYRRQSQPHDRACCGTRRGQP